MTISDYLRRRVRFLLLALLGAWLAIPLSIAAFGPDAETSIGLPWPLFLCLPAFAGIMFLLARTRCPMCKDSLYGSVGDIGLSRQQELARYCPSCRADFHQPMEGVSGP
jgi:hypothetical protein